MRPCHWVNFYPRFRGVLEAAYTNLQITDNLSGIWTLSIYQTTSKYSCILWLFHYTSVSRWVSDRNCSFINLLYIYVILVSTAEFQRRRLTGSLSFQLTELRNFLWWTLLLATLSVQCNESSLMQYRRLEGTSLADDVFLVSAITRRHTTTLKSTTLKSCFIFCNSYPPTVYELHILL
jgi:hypothetical protein